MTSTEQGKLLVAFGALALSACASTGSLIAEPDVRLTGVTTSELSFSGQTFQLSFDVENPNPFPLPVKSFRYYVELENRNFASGEAVADIAIPAQGRGALDVSVTVDALRQASSLPLLLRDSARGPLNYRLSGSFVVDVPGMPPVPFKTSGVVALGATH